MAEEAKLFNYPFPYLYDEVSCCQSQLLSFFISCPKFFPPLYFLHSSSLCILSPFEHTTLAYFNWLAFCQNFHTLLVVRLIFYGVIIVVVVYTSEGLCCNWNISQEANSLIGKVSFLVYNKPQHSVAKMEKRKEKVQTYLNIVQTIDYIGATFSLLNFDPSY